jgi:hypothetical protein
MMQLSPTATLTLAAAFPMGHRHDGKVPRYLTLDTALSFLDPRSSLQDLARATLSFMLRGVVCDEVDDAAMTLYRALDFQGRVNLCKLAFDQRVDCGVVLRSRLLHFAWGTGMCSIPKEKVVFHSFDHSEMFAWFARTEAASRMSAREQTSFVELPDQFTVYRGASAATIEDAGSSFSWSRDINVARRYAAMSYPKLPTRRMVVVGKISKAAVISCHWWERTAEMAPNTQVVGQEGIEPEVIIDYRLVQNLREVEELQHVV